MTATQTIAPPTSHANPHHERRWLILALLGTAQLMVVLDATAPSALSLLTTTFTEPRERGIAFGIYGAVAGAGGAVGLLLGGVLTEYLSWRWCLYVNVVIAVPAIVAALGLLTNDVPGERPRLDVPGAVAVSFGLFALVYGFSQAEPRGWTDPVTLISLATGAIVLVLFVVIERRAAHPLLPLRIVLDRNRGGSYLSVLISGAGMFAVFLDRVAQAMRLEEIDEPEARRRQRTSDRARIDYVKHFYRADPRDPRHYHLLLASTALPLDACVQLIVTAARAQQQRRSGSARTPGS